MRSLLRLLLVCLVTALLGEAALRVGHRLRPLPMLFDDGYNRFRGRPHAPEYGFRLNSLGFKDQEFSPEKGDRYRILALGDSFAYGVVPYRHNYLTLLEDGLHRPEAPVEVLNMGIPNLGPLEYEALLVREGLRYEPDLVLVSFFLGNDFKNCRPGGGRSSRRSPSYLLTFLDFLLRVRPAFQGRLIHGAVEYVDEAPTLRRREFLECEARRGRICLIQDPVFEELLPMTLPPLERIRDLCRAHDMELLLVLIPDQIQIDAELRDEILSPVPQVRPEHLDWRLPNRRLTQELDREEIPWLDLTEPFAEAIRTERLYKPLDTHWNIAGNRLAARLIAERIAGGM